MVIHHTLRPAISTLRSSTRPWPTVTCLILTDLASLTLASYLSVHLRLFFDGQYHPSLYWRLWPVLGIFILAYSLVGLYPGVGISPVDELRRVSLTTSLLYMALGAAIFLFREVEVYSRGVFLLAWGFSIALVLLGRFILRKGCAHRHWWGYPVLVLGAGKTGWMVVETLQQCPELGLKPIAVLDDDPYKQGTVAGVPVVGDLALAPKLARKLHIPYAIVAMPGVQREKLLFLLERYGQSFLHTLIIPDLFGFSSLWVSARDLGGILGLEVRQQLLLPGPQLIKTTLDYSLALLLGILLSPLIAIIALLIKLDSPGPIFYRQERLGRHGRPFKAVKFRSMVRNADQVLHYYLEQHPELQAGWALDQKLKHDPRITPLGHFLRRTSLDELPQLWNVLRREMSLVGPRPIVHEEVWRYGEKFDLYARVLPGITGLWQVSGRNNVTYDQRVNLDAYYVRNWSVWLDVYILIRTLWVVITGEGAY